MTFAAVVVLGYLLGSCPWGYWLVRLIRHEDIRKVGSGNIGATNVWRTYGRWLGVPVVLLDVLKGFVPGVARDAVRLASRRDLRRRRGDARPLAAALPALRQGREDGRDLRRRLLRRRGLGGADRLPRVARHLPALPLRVRRVDRRRHLAAGDGRGLRLSHAGRRLRRGRRRRRSCICIEATCAASAPAPSTGSGSGGPRVRRLLVLLVVGRPRSGAPPARSPQAGAAPGESAVDRPDATTGAQIHAHLGRACRQPRHVRDGRRRSWPTTSRRCRRGGSVRTRRARRASTTRRSRPGSCADISFVRLAEPASVVRRREQRLRLGRAATSSRWASPTSSRSTSSTTTARRSRRTSAARVPATSRPGPSFAIVWLAGVPGRPDRRDRGARALARARRAARRRAERVHRREQPGRRVRRRGASVRLEQGRALSGGDPRRAALAARPRLQPRRLLRPLGHAGTTSRTPTWLHLLAAPLVPLALNDRRRGTS